MKTILFVKNLILDAVFPHKCLCGKTGILLCDDCKNKIRIKNTQLCPLCKKISTNGKTCSKCGSKSYLTGVLVLAPHEGIIKDIIWDFKYNFISEFAEPLSKIIYEKHGDFIKKKKFIITAVPISKRRMRWRGYNQAELLARGLARNANLEYINFLAKKEDVAPQVGLSRKQRIENIRGKINLNLGLKIEDIKGKRILIVDDVYTTGSTLEECAKKLREAGFREVWGIVLSRD